MREFLSTILAPILRLGSPTGPTVTPGTGSPEGVLSAPVGSQYLRSDGGTGTTLYVKESGTGNTGWRAIAPGSGPGPDIGPLFLTGGAVEFTIPNDASEIVSVSATAVGYVLILPNPADVAEGKRFVIRVEGSFNIALRVPVGASFGQFTVTSGTSLSYIRGFEVDGTTPSWAREHQSTTLYRMISAEALFTRSYDGLAPLYVGIDNALVEASLDDGAMWLTDTALKVKVDGVVYNLTAPSGGASPVLSWVI